MFRSLGALVGDLLVVILFVTIGFLQHGTPLTSENIALVGWPFALGVLLGHLAIRAWNAPFRIWPHGLFVWAITLAATMAIRTLFAAGTEVSFIITTAIITAVGMLGWRAVALFLTRGERRRPKVVTGAEAAEATTLQSSTEHGPEVGEGTDGVEAGGGSDGETSPSSGSEAHDPEAGGSDAARSGHAGRPERPAHPEAGDPTEADIPPSGRDASR